MAGTILFPTDYSDVSNAAFPFAVALARQEAGNLVILHVDNVKEREAGGGSTSDERSDQLRDFLRNADLFESTGFTHVFRSVEGDAGDEILRVAAEEQARLIVMATSGRSVLGRLLLGSVTRKVMRSSTCPVLTIKQPKAEADQESIDSRSLDEVSALTVLQRAVEARATDIHLDPTLDGWEIRFRIDGRLVHICFLSMESGHGVATQLKVMAELDIANPFPAQEGQLTLDHALPGHEVRLTRVPVRGGEALALRLHSRERLLRPLETIGLSADCLSRVHEMLRHAAGIVLVTGPTGAGKTTTLYSMIHALDDGQRNIVGIEDPPEYRVPGFRQMVADARHGVTMASGLRSLLRMDPDLLLVGEIRDAETAQVAMRAAASGKHVFTTLHARDVAATVTALRDLGVDNRSLAANLSGIISQRLIRRVCQRCHKVQPIDFASAEQFAHASVDAPANVLLASGCDQCRQSGYFERIGIFEVVIATKAIRQSIAGNATEEALRDVIRREGATSILADGLMKVAAGHTTMSEINGMTWPHHDPQETAP